MPLSSCFASAKSCLLTHAPVHTFPCTFTLASPWLLSSVPSFQTPAVYFCRSSCIPIPLLLISAGRPPYRIHHIFSSAPAHTPHYSACLQAPFTLIAEILLFYFCFTRFFSNLCLFDRSRAFRYDSPFYFVCPPKCVFPFFSRHFTDSLWIFPLSSFQFSAALHFLQIPCLLYRLFTPFGLQAQPLFDIVQKYVLVAVKHGALTGNHAAKRLKIILRAV